MKEKEHIKLALDLGCEELEDFGMVPFLRVKYILSSTMEKHDALDVLSTYKNYDALFVEPAIKAGNQLKRYSYSYVNVSDVRHGDKQLVSRISPNATKYSNYNEMINDFGQLISNIYYDFEGKISIELTDGQKLNPASLLSSDSHFARSEIARAVASILNDKLSQIYNNKKNETSYKR